MTDRTAFRASLLSLLFLAACDRTPAPEAGPPPVDLSGTWRAVLASPGGELPFVLEIQEQPDGGYRAAAVNGEERAPFSHVSIAGDRVELGFSWYDAEISAQISRDGSVMRGRWRKTAASGDSVLDFSATRGFAVRFLPIAEQPAEGPEDVSGAWAVEFRDDSSTDLARGEFRQNGTHLEGTFLTPTGDYRYLEGSYENGRLRLSTFDGAHAFLFTASAQSDGSLSGDFWSRDSYHATWRAVPADGDAGVLPDAWSQVSLTTADDTIAFAFEDLDGDLVTLNDARFAGKPVIVSLFGSWCPNCNDEAPLLSRWYKENRGRGLEMVGLAFEYTGEIMRDREMVRRFRDRHDIEYPLLIAGTTDKADAAAAIGFLDRVLAYPTTIFLDRDHRVVKIHSGFAGPGTGEHYTSLVAEFEAQIERLLIPTSRG